MKKCPKTMSGNHIWVEQAIGNVGIKLCAACGLVDDREIKESIDKPLPK